MHDCLVPITAWIGNIFESIRRNDKVPGRVRAVDMRNLLLLLPFLLHNLLEEEVEEYNSIHPFDPIVDPSNECIGIVLVFIDWYHLFRRRYPPKDEVDIQDLQGQSLRLYFFELRSLRLHTTYILLRIKLKNYFADFWTDAALCFRSRTSTIVT